MHLPLAALILSSMLPSPEEKNILQKLADLQVTVETTDPAAPEYAALKDAYDKKAEEVARQFPAFQTLFKLYLADARAKRRSSMSRQDAEEATARKKEKAQQHVADDTEALRKGLRSDTHSRRYPKP